MSESAPPPHTHTHIHTYPDRQFSYCHGVESFVRRDIDGSDAMKMYAYTVNPGN